MASRGRKAKLESAAARIRHTRMEAPAKIKARFSSG